MSSFGRQDPDAPGGSHAHAHGAGGGGQRDLEAARQTLAPSRKHEERVRCDRHRESQGIGRARAVSVERQSALFKI